jgi:hypothetical protein
MKGRTLEQRILSKSTYCSNGCIEWTGWVQRNGYGTIWISEQDNKHSVHSLVWELENGNIPPGTYICHTCDNRKCINIDHLYAGTPQSNMTDMSIRGRANVKHSVPDIVIKLSDA